MKNKLMPLMDKVLLRKRPLIETVNEQLNNICQIEHSRHRCVANCLVNLVAGLRQYVLREKTLLAPTDGPDYRTLCSRPLVRSNSRLTCGQTLLPIKKSRGSSTLSACDSYETTRTLSCALRQISAPARRTCPAAAGYARALAKER
jgi:hypothetical protein